MSYRYELDSPPKGVDDLNSTDIKIAVSAIVAVLIVISIPLIGLTTAEIDDAEGVVIDFGYWNVVWVPMSFEEGMDGNDALEKACDIAGYDIVFLDEEKTQVFSIDGQVNLYGMEWGMYVLESDSWKAVEDVKEIDVSEIGFICWGRASGEEGVVPGTDTTGFTYYGYANDGFSSSTGEKLRVVSLAPSVTEILTSVGGLDMIVGTDLYSNYPQEIVDKKNKGEISVIGGYTDPNYEWIIKVNPDIVFCDGGTGEHISMANKLRKSGINCVVLYDAVNIETLYNNIWIAASALGLEENANKSINIARITIDNIIGVIGTQAAKRTFFALSTDPSPWTSGSHTFVSDMISKISGINVFDTQSSSWFMVSKEQIHTKQPSVIVIIYDAMEITTMEEYQSAIDRLDPVWKETPAYRNGNVFFFTGSSADILSRPGPRLAEATELLAKVMHPEPFTNRDPLDVVPKFFGNDYKTYLKYQESSA